MQKYCNKNSYKKGEKKNKERKKKEFLVEVEKIGQRKCQIKKKLPNRIKSRKSEIPRKDQN